MEESWPSSMDKAHVREGPHPIKKPQKLQYLQIRYLNPLVIDR